MQRLACTPRRWCISSHLDALVDNARFVPSANWAVAKIKTEIKFAKVLGTDTVGGTKIEPITRIVQVELEILGDLEGDICLTGDMMTLRLSDAIFEINVPGGWLVGSLAKGGD